MRVFVREVKGEQEEHALLGCSQGGLFATFGGKMIGPLVVKDSFLRGSPNFSQKVAKKTPPAPSHFLIFTHPFWTPGHEECWDTVHTFERCCPEDNRGDGSPRVGRVLPPFVWGHITDITYLKIVII